MNLCALAAMVFALLLHASRTTSRLRAAAAFAVLEPGPGRPGRLR